MSKGTTPLAEAVRFPVDLVSLIRARAREVIEMVLEEEWKAAPGAMSGPSNGRATATARGSGR